MINPGVTISNSLGDGVSANTGSWLIENYGSIRSTNTVGDGVFLGGAGGSVTNAASASITGAEGGVVVTGGAGTVVNYSNIIGATGNGATTGYGVLLEAGGSVTNAASASIIGGEFGVDLAAGGTLTDAGRVVGNAGTAVSFGGTGSNLLVLDPGYGLSGVASGGTSASNTLELASAASTGTLSGLGTKFVDFGQTTIDADASWVFNGENTIEAGTTLTELSGAMLDVAGTLVNDGTIILDPSTLVVGGLTGTGVVTIDADSTLEVQGTVASGETIMFAGAGADLRLDDPDIVTGSVTNFAPGETIELKGVDHTSVSYDASDGVLSFSGGHFALSLANPGAVIASPSGSDSLVSVVCFRAGTRILTPRGEVAVETLQAGEPVLARAGDGRMESRRVVWIGRRSVDCRRHPSPELVWPVRIDAGAFGSGQPQRDLYLSPDHAVFVNDVLIPIRLLINGATVTQAPVAAVTYFHVELAAHAVLLAEGLPAESYLDTGNRGIFENAEAPLVLHPDFATADGQHLRETRSCAPFAADAARVEPVWRRLAARALELGYALPELQTTDDPDLRLLVDEREVRPLSAADNRYVFVLSRSCGVVRLLSRAARPCEVRPWIEDRRRLGVMVRRIKLQQGHEVVTIPPDHPMLIDGWWGVEGDRTALWRWTNGDAAVPVSLEAAVTLEVEVAGTVSYVVRRCSSSAAEMLADQHARDAQRYAI